MSGPGLSPAPALGVEGLTVTKGPSPAGQRLVNDVDLSIESGETLGIVGESGSGKSLTARAIMRLLPRGLHASGTIRFGDLSVLDAGEDQLREVRGSRLSLLMQDPFTMLNPLQTVGTTIWESLDREVQGSRAEAMREVDRRLEEVALTAEVKERYPFELSGGMRQRVALAAALSRDPSLLIADEPTTALDVTTQEEILALLRQIKENRGMALILITHDLRLAFSVCDRIQVMYAGSVVERAPAGQLAGQPLHPYSKALLLSELPVGQYVSEIKTIPGRVPSADAVMGQCAFADRCAWATERCVAEKPPLRGLGEGRASACIRIEEIRGELQAEVHAFGESQAPRYQEGRDRSPIVTVCGLTKTYETSRLFGSKRIVKALEDVSFEIGRGESVGLVGETGSGKSTIGRCILGLTTADSGEIVIDGIEAGSYRQLDRDQRRRVRRVVQAVFQDPHASLNPARTIGSTLTEVLRHSPAVENEGETVDDLLRSVGLPVGYAARRPAALSGGERQRVAIARALAMQPQLLICDEAVASLDISAQAQILKLLRKLRRERQMSMLFITHDLSVVRQMSDRIVVLYRGQVVEHGNTESVLNDPGHAYTRRLLSAVPGQAEPSPEVADQVPSGDANPR